MKKILLPENLNNFVTLLQNYWGDYSFDNTEFVINVDKNTLNNINNDLYHKVNYDGNPNDTDEIIINLNNYKFIYRLEE